MEVLFESKGIEPLGSIALHGQGSLHFLHALSASCVQGKEGVATGRHSNWNKKLSNPVSTAHTLCPTAVSILFWLSSRALLGLLFTILCQLGQYLQNREFKIQNQDFRPCKTFSSKRSI